MGTCLEGERVVEDLNIARSGGGLALDSLVHTSGLGSNGGGEGAEGGYGEEGGAHVGEKLKECGLKNVGSRENGK